MSKYFVFNLSVYRKAIIFTKKIRMINDKKGVVVLPIYK